MKKIVQLFKSLTARDHFFIFLIILSVLKVADVFADDGSEAGFHFLKLGVALLAISTVLFFAFKYLFDKKKKYQNALISTFLILLVLSHGDPDPVKGIAVIVFVYISKFFVKYQKRNIFNPLVFSIGLVTILAEFLTKMGTPPLNWAGINIRFEIFQTAVPIALLPIALALIFNVGRMRKYPLAFSFIGFSLALGFLLGIQVQDPVLFILSTTFVGVAILTEPKTSPVKKAEQMVYGALIALLITGLYYWNVPNAAIMGIFVGNISYFLWRIFANKKLALR